MPTLSTAALAFVARLVRARDTESLHRAFKQGLAPLFRHYSILASSHVPRFGFKSMWASARIPRRGPAWWARHDAIHPAFPFLRARPGMTVCTMSDVLSSDELDRHPFYREFMRPLGWRYGLALIVWLDGDIAAIVAISRARRQGDFDDADRALALALQPFVAAAWERIADHSRELDTLRAQETLISSLPVASLVYSARAGRVLFYNRAAREAVARWRGEGGRKRPRALTARWLPAEIVAACEDLPAGGAEVTCAREGMRALLRRMDPRPHFASEVVLIVIEEDHTGAAAPSVGWLQIARRFTTAELEVAREAARGLSNRDIGRALGKSPLTVKKQLESIFAKAGVTSRAALGALYGGRAKSARQRAT